MAPDILTETHDVKIEPTVKKRTQTKVTTVQEAIAAAAAEIGAVGKNQKMEAGPAKYKYRGLDDLVDAIHQPLCDNGVVFAPHSIQVLDTLERTTKSGSTQHHLRALVTYRVYGPAGDYIEATILAEGTDTGDKAGNKLMSAAYKYACGQVLSLPYTMDDQDASLSEPVTTANPIPNLLETLQKMADSLGMDVESLTGKWRASNGGISVDDMIVLSSDRVRPFLRQVEAAIKARN